MDTSAGMKVSIIILPAVTCPPIQSMIVVTSPIGDHAPPALAPSMTIPQKNQRVFWSAINFLNKAHITMEVVRLSNTDDMKNVRIPIIHNNLRLFVVVILFVMMEKPSCLSTISTIVIAPKRKKRISEVSPRCSIRFSLLIPGPKRA